ncbi:hypothetical protein [Spirillospora sp. NPDC029432]|uniref:hypothetical protein n=1 Tax=Spirillospora sp. NPDC029432 TaxID=3154599 RepID=UPI0034513160
MNVRHLLALAAPLLVVAVGTPAYTFFSAGPTASVDTSAAAQAPGKDAYALQVGTGPDAAALAGLAGRLETTGLPALLTAEGGGRGEWDGDCAAAAKVPAGSRVFCFGGADGAASGWRPQGVTGVSDARADERWGAYRPLLVGWADDGKSPRRSVRVTFVNTRNGAYHHALLVWPYRDSRGRPTYEPIGKAGTGTGARAGGIAWYGNRLYLADAAAGIRVFDMRRIFDLGKSPGGATANPGLVGLNGRKYYGYGHRYVMPQVYSYVPAKKAGASCTGDGTPNHSWLAVDRTGGDRLVTGERCENGEGRVAAFPLAYGSSDLATDGGGLATPSMVARLPASHVQGGAVSGGTWWFARGAGPQGELVQARLTGRGFEEVRRQAVPSGSADLHCWRGADRLWTVAGDGGRRVLYGMPRSEC